MNRKQRNEISKFLSYVLRHAPQTIGIQLDSDGWASVDALFKGARNQGRSLNMDSIREIVETDDKKRFSISKDSQSIRAVQGHSIATVNLQYKEIEPPEFLYHGTTSRFLDSIKEQGLVPGLRHHVHLSQDMEAAVKVGARHGKSVVLEVEALKMHQQGFKFFQADNGVWLSIYIPVGFIRLVQNQI